MILIHLGGFASWDEIVLLANDWDQRSRASDSGPGTKAQSRGSLPPAYWAGLLGSRLQRGISFD
jgi:hypothetical protein